MKIPAQINEKHFDFNVDEEIVSIFSYAEIHAVKADMVKNKYSTRLELQNSRDIVSIYEKRYKRRQLTPIIDLLSRIEQQYNRYEWTPQKMAEYKSEEKERIIKNEMEINAVIDHSTLLMFKIV